MRNHRETQSRQRAIWMLEGLGIVLAYFGTVAVLMYPVVDAAGFLA